MGSVSHLGNLAPDILNIPKIFYDYVVKSNSICNKDFFLCFMLRLFFSLSRDHLKFNTFIGCIKKKINTVLSDLLWGKSKVKNSVIFFSNIKPIFNIAFQISYSFLIYLCSLHLMLCSYLFKEFLQATYSDLFI